MNSRRSLNVDVSSYQGVVKALLLAIAVFAQPAVATGPTESASLAAVNGASPGTPATPGSISPVPIPKFASYSDVREKKTAFFEYMNPKVQLVNDEVWEKRLYLLEQQEKLASTVLTEEETAILRALGEHYKLPPAENVDAGYFESLLKRVDVVPASLALAQAANESAWGTSRFAREGRNFFGTWCFEPGCGIPPRHRQEGTVHEVHEFETVLDGIRFYVHHINSSNMYRRLRNLRAQVREEDEKPTGAHLAVGLTAYSARGQAYVEEIKAMIRQNNLSRYSVRREVAPLTTATSQ